MCSFFLVEIELVDEKERLSKLSTLYALQHMGLWWLDQFRLVCSIMPKSLRVSFDVMKSLPIL